MGLIQNYLLRAYRGETQTRTDAIPSIERRRKEIISGSIAVKTQRQIEQLAQKLSTVGVNIKLSIEGQGDTQYVRFESEQAITPKQEARFIAAADSAGLTVTNYMFPCERIKGASPAGYRIAATSPLIDSFNYPGFSVTERPNFIPEKSQIDRLNAIITGKIDTHNEIPEVGVETPA